MRRLCAVVLLAVSLLAVSCGSSSDDDGEGQTTPSDTEATETETPDTEAPDSEDADADMSETETPDGDDGEDEPEPEPVVLTNSWTGVTAETIKVGVAGIDFARLQEFGVDIEGINTDVWAPSWAEAFNQRGGAFGRMMEVYVRDFLPVGNIESDAVCSELTEDEGVFVVLGLMLGDNPLCVTQLHKTPYVGLFGLTAERAEKSIAPFFASEMAADLQRGTPPRHLSIRAHSMASGWRSTGRLRMTPWLKMWFCRCWKKQASKSWPPAHCWISPGILLHPKLL